MIATVVDWNGKELVYGTPNKNTAWRVDTLATKEPDTLAWIEEFKPGDSLLDIGANVGMYTIFAAVVSETRVFAFEPESQNFAQLNWNIRRNDITSLVTAYPLAMSDKPGFDTLYMATEGIGGSCHTFGEEVNFRLEPMKSAARQGSYATTVDSFYVSGAFYPSGDFHIKIDVDGIEHLVLAGAQYALKHAAVKSVLVEINTNIKEHASLVSNMESLGFECSIAPGAIREEGPFKGVGNHIFRR